MGETLESLISRKALTGLHWYDFEGNEHTLDEHIEKVNYIMDNILPLYDDLHILEITDTDTAPGLTYSAYVYHKSICEVILDNYGINEDVKFFIFKSEYITFDHTSNEYRAITDMYQADNTNAIEEYLFEE